MATGSGGAIAAGEGGAGPSVEVLLATYNNAAWLDPLLDSLLAQSVQDFRLVVSDDCSTDGTRDILARRLPEFRHPPRLILRDSRSGSATANFAFLMRHSRAERVFLCDADDIWHPAKIETFLRRADRGRGASAEEAPLLLFSDAEVIDAAGRRRHPSYWAFKKFDPATCLTLERLLVCPAILGCATMMNRALVELARDIPVAETPGHDWWVALVAGCFGEVDYLAEPTLSYRVHGGNSSQPKPVGLVAFAGRARGLAAARHEVRRRLEIRRRQAAALLAQFGDRMPSDRRRVIETFLAAGERGFLGRRRILFGGGYTYPDPARNLALMLFA